MTRILIAGDWHGFTEQGVFALHVAKKYDCDIVFQLGDFGYWEHFDDGIVYLDKLNRVSKQTDDIPIYWIDGNHENHPLLWKTYEDRDDEDGFLQIRDNIFYCPRGNVWEWDGVRFMGMGGAFSIDRNARKVGKSFWFEETITEDDVLNAIYQLNGEYVDVMFTHDTPLQVDLPFQMAKQGRSISMSSESTANRILLDDVITKAQPKYLFHGHMHLNYKDKVKMQYGYRYDGLHVHGLDEGSAGMDAIWILDTRDVVDLRDNGLVDKP